MRSLMILTLASFSLMLATAGCLHSKENSSKAKSTSKVEYPLEEYVDEDGKTKTRIINGAAVDSPP